MLISAGGIHPALGRPKLAKSDKLESFRTLNVWKKWLEYMLAPYGGSTVLNEIRTNIETRTAIYKLL